MRLHSFCRAVVTLFLNPWKNSVHRVPLFNTQNDPVVWENFPSPVPYPLGLEAMEHQVQQIAVQAAKEQIWLLEHEEVYTLGSSGTHTDILVSPSIPVIETGRGGQVTYHGPGQRVGYVLLNLRKRKLDNKRYVSKIQKWIQNTVTQKNC